MPTKHVPEWFERVADLCHIDVTLAWRPRRYSEIQEVREAQGIRLNDYMYRQHGWDTVALGSQNPRDGAGYVIYNTYTGVFFGKTPAGYPFDCRDWKPSRELNRKAMERIVRCLWGYEEYQA